ncbi:MAG: hypothetical protein ACREQF_05145 [Candidatus Binataceae bacterium]
MAVVGLVALALAAIWPAGVGSLARAAAKRLEVEFGYEIRALKTKGLTAPTYMVPQAGGKMVVADAPGGLFTVTGAGAVTELVGAAKLKNPAGVAVAPAGFGGFAGQVFVLSSADSKSPCEVQRVDQSGATSVFASLPAVGEGDAGKPTGCRDVAFGAAGGPFSGKLYAVVSDNATVYEIDGSGKARAFGTFNKPVDFELSGINFTSATDTKAPNAMLLGMRAKMTGAAKVGRIGVIGADGKLSDNPYYVGFVRPNAFGYAPANWGPYAGEFLIVDAGKLAADSAGERDGVVLRVEKGVPHSFAAGLVDPSCLKWVGSKLYVCDRADKGTGQGSLIVLSSML